MSCAVPHEGINRTGRMIAIGPLLLRFFLLLVVLVGRGDSSCPTGALEIDSTSTSIGAAAYKDCTAITAVTIPAAVTAIDATAFSGCTAITKLTRQARQTRAWHAPSTHTLLAAALLSVVLALAERARKARRVLRRVSPPSRHRSLSRTGKTC